MFKIGIAYSKCQFIGFEEMLKKYTVVTFSKKKLAFDKIGCIFMVYVEFKHLFGCYM